LYTPLLAGATVGTVHHGNIIEPIRDVLGGKDDAAYVQATAVSVDLERRVVVCELPEEYDDGDASAKRHDGSPKTAAAVVAPTGTSQAEFGYDKLVIAVGARPATFGIPGVEEHAFFLKELDHSAVLQQRILSCLERASALQTVGSAKAAAAASASSGNGNDGSGGSAGGGSGGDSGSRGNDDSGSEEYNPNAEAVRKLLHFVVVGGGPTGVELAAELSDFVRSDVSRLFPTLAPKVRITLLEAAPRILGPFQDALASHATAHLEAQGVEVRCCTGVTAVLGPHRATVKSTAKTSTTTRKTTEATKTTPPPQSTISWFGAGKKKIEEEPPPPPQQPEEVEVVDFGALVWAAGISTRPLVCDLATSLGSAAGQTAPRRGVAVDQSLRVKGVKEGNVFALGDCALSGLPPTAQVAAQQGKWLGRLLRDCKEGTLTPPTTATPLSMKEVTTSATTKLVKEEVTPAVTASATKKSSPPTPLSPPTPPPHFEYQDKGKMAYIGSKQAIVVTKPSLGEPPLQRLRDHVWWRSLHGAAAPSLEAAEDLSFAVSSSSPSLSSLSPEQERKEKFTPPEERTLTGGAAFAFWRGVYFSKLLSGSNRLAVATDWLRAELFGRDVTVHQAQMKRQVTRARGARNS
jgi:NADH:ubiquinone reductase (non-electrogenic)